MEQVKWIKLYTDIFNNRKIKQIESIPEGDAILVIWLKILVLAGTVNDSGQLYLTKEIPYTDQMLSNAFGKPLATVQLALDVFIKFGMIEITNDIMKVSNWNKYQSVDGMERIKEQTRNRVANYRERQKQIPKITKADMEMEDVDIMELQRKMFGKKEDKSIDVEAIFKEAGV